MFVFSARRFNVSVNIELATSFQLVPSATSSGARYAQNNELFGHIQLGFDISEDTAGGRLILQNVTTVYIIPHSRDKSSSKVRFFPVRLYCRRFECKLH